jgi:divalent anion:Na+ symporter, DASS family
MTLPLMPIVTDFCELKNSERPKEKRRGVPLPLISSGPFFASSYFSVITPQGGSQTIIFAASGYLTQREFYKLGLIVTLAFLAVYLLIGSPWVYFVMH